MILLSRNWHQSPSGLPPNYLIMIILFRDALPEKVEDEFDALRENVKDNFRRKDTEACLK